MINFRNSALIAALATASAISVSAPAQAQAIKGVAVVDDAKVVENSTAAKGAEQAMASQYAQDFQLFQQTKQALESQLQPLYTQFDAERNKPQPNRQVLEQLAGQITDLQSQGEARLKQISEPISIARLYVGEQLSNRIRTAIAAVAARRQITVVVSASSTFYTSPSVDITNEVIAELNKDTSPIAVVPPQQWLQSKGLAAGGAPSAVPTTPQPEGR